MRHETLDFKKFSTPLMQFLRSPGLMDLEKTFQFLSIGTIFNPSEILLDSPFGTTVS
jgi:hypothetical protein